MSVTYTWSIPNNNGIFTTNTLGQNNVVSMVRYEISATDGTNTVSRMDVVELTYNAEDSFIPYQNLTQSQVITWIQNSMGTEKINRIKQQLQNKLNNLANPPSKPTPQSVPWSN
jgi:hypothetical protein